MSLIRSGSNPEGMYVFGGWTQPMELSSGSGWLLGNIGPDDPAGQQSMVVPTKVFYAVCRKAVYVTEDSPVEIGGFRVEETHVYVRSGRKVPENWMRQKGIFKGRCAPTLFAIKLSYGDRYVLMYRVTWEYIRRNAVGQESSEKQERRKRKRK